MKIKNENKYLKLNIQLFASGADAEVKFKVVLDDANANQKIGNLEKKSGSAGTALNKIGSIGKAAFKTTAIAAGTATVALGGLITKSVQMAGELEQQLGGSEAVFEQFAETVQKKGAEAYKVMGLSQNDYLATANKMGSLMQGAGLSVEKSMDLSTKAMQRAADVASVMGIDVNSAMESIAGAAKGNFTMMDNLGVAMNATTIEAYALEHGITKTFDSMTNAEKVGLAMEMFLEKTSKYEGNYAKENETFAGSLTTLKAAFSNFMSGASDIEPVIDSLMSFLDIVVDSIVEMAPKIIAGIIKLVNSIVPEIPNILQSLLPVLINGVIDLLNALVKVIPTIIPILMDAIVQLVKGLVPMLPTIIQALLTGVIVIVNALADALPELLPIIIETILMLIPLLLDNLPLFIEAAFKLITGLLQGMIQATPIVWSYIPKIISGIINYFRKMPKTLLSIGKNLVVGLWNGIKNAKDWVLNKIKDFGNSVLDGIKKIFGVHSPSTEFAWIGKMNVLGLEEGIESMKGDLDSTITDTIGIDFLKNGSMNVSHAFSNSTPNYNSANQNNITIIADMDVNKFGKAFVKDIKTFSGGAKNSYNYGGMQ